MTDKDRWIVWFRDGFTCAYCGYEGTLLRTFNLVVGHKIPLGRGGTDAVSNLQTLCVACAAEKGGRTDAEFRAHRSLQRRPILAS